ncbi:MAG: DUF6279 family lipoprotein [Gammaproteobacteria bacterium]
MSQPSRTLLPFCNVRFVGVLALLVLLAGCSTNFFYERIDWFVVWRINSYVSLTDQQKADLKQDVSDQLEYMRTNDLPRVADLLNRSALDIESGFVTPEMIDARYNEMLAEFDKFMLQIVPIAMRFLRGLDEEQVAELFENFEEANQEMYEEYSGRTPEEREKNRNKSAIKSTQEWTGKLSPEQKDLIKKALAEMEDASEQWIEYQREWQRRFRTLIETRPPEDEYRAELTQLFVYPRDLHSTEYRATVDANRVILNEMLADLFNGLKDKQRKRMVKRLNGYANDLLKISQAR